MPSLFSKLITPTKHNNPYSNPHHPSHAPLPPVQTTPHSTTQADIARQSATLHPQAPNMLAEARQLANRNPITGRLLPSAQSASDTDFASNARLEKAMTAIERLGPSKERSAYLNRASQTRVSSGNRYDLRAAEEVRKREEEERMRRAMAGVEFYAPERRVEEFYAGGLSGNGR